MLLLGENQAILYIITTTQNKFNIIKKKNAFYGYKLDDRSGNNGIFIEWSHQDNHFRLSNDRLGFFPIYYTFFPNGLAISSCITDLLPIVAQHSAEHCIALNDTALAVFLRFGSFIGNSTPFQNIYALAPNSTLEYHKGKFTLQNCPILPQENVNISRETAKKIYGQLFQHAIEKFGNLQNTKIGLPLSGGRDSRHILFALLRAKKRPFSCITMRHQAPRPDEDVRIAKQICAYAGENHIILEQPLSILRAEQEKNLITNFCSLEHSWILPLAHYLSAEKYNVIFDGIAGDILSAGVFLTSERLTLYRNGKLEELAEELLGSEKYIKRLLSTSAYQRFSREKARAMMVDELKKHTTAPNPVGQFFLLNRTRRNIAMNTFRILAGQCRVFAPFLDNEVYDFLSSLPGEYFVDHTFHQESVSEYYPEYANLPYEQKNASQKQNTSLVNFYQLCEYSIYFLPTLFSQSTFINPFFLYYMTQKGFRSSIFYSQWCYIYRIAIYLHQLAEVIKIKSVHQN